MGKRLCAVPVIALLCIGCLGEERVVMTETGPTPDMTHEADGAVTRFYDSDNPHTREVIGRLIRDRHVLAELNRFGAMGYALSVENSFVAAGDTEDGRHLELTVLSLGGGSAPERDAVYLFYLGGKRVEILPIELRLEEPEDPAQFSGAGEGAWMRPIEPLHATAGLGEDPARAWNWRRWAKCVTGSIVADATTCAIACRFAPVVYLKCAIACSAIRALASIFECSIQEL
jgi:hypothetical protein